MAKRSSPSPDCGQRLALRSPGLRIPLSAGERERRRQSFPSPLWGGVRGGGILALPLRGDPHPRLRRDLPSRGRWRGSTSALTSPLVGEGAERKRGGEGALAQRSSPSPDCGQRLAFRSPGLRIPLPAGERGEVAPFGGPGTVCFSGTWTWARNAGEESKLSPWFRAADAVTPTRACGATSPQGEVKRGAGTNLPLPLLNRLDYTTPSNRPGIA